LPVIKLIIASYQVRLSLSGLSHRSISAGAILIRPHFTIARVVTSEKLRLRRKN